MMSHEQARGIVNTIIDGIKDAQMQYEYACEAKAAGNAELAKIHLAEANKRIGGVSEWHKLAEGMIERRDEHDPVYTAMYDYYADWARTLRGKIAEMKL